ncbi:copper resistance protein NlpE N-terminal domain-containing protein [Motilimonas sp. 1_MG-2023]|uniref:copper resistance protein NlpE n=1 Tax=Motilimonas sp. 1_MG-2023 TaxID=3062672 RepID=UPI0026E20948|nr:copper resistance protein NlpE [Motilimonas sp. 1_MG-2023]MDO6526033.1 copper resistance protein NlpE N-terminal domain-containing protein [Motilimonas sp. 1_MG-2023]
MKQAPFLSLLAALALVGCQSKQAAQETKTTAPETMIVVDAANARSSLDWNGVYRGILPCDDCDGIEVFIELKPNNTYALSRKFLGKMGVAVVEAAPFTWNDAGNTITIEGGTQFFIGENKMWLVDENGERLMDDARAILKEM